MSLHQQSCAVVALIAVLCLTQIIAQDKAPEWKEDSDPYFNQPFVRALEGNEIKLSCPAKGRPKPDVIWYRDNQPFFPRDPNIRLKGANLKFSDPTAADSGNYTCVAQNALGKIEFTFIVAIEEKVWPLEVEVSSNVTVFEGESASFYCRVLNDNNAKIQWLRLQSTDGRNPLAPTYLASADESPEVLVLHDIGLGDAGQYTCLIGNEFGSKYQHMYLTVLKPTTTTSTTTTTTTPTTTTTTSTTTTPTTTTSTTTSTTPSTTGAAKKKKKDRKKNRKDKKKDKKKKNKKKDKEKNKDQYNFDEDFIDQTYVTKDPYGENDFDVYDPYKKKDNSVFNSNTNMYEPVNAKDVDKYKTNNQWDRDEFYNFDDDAEEEEEDNDENMVTNVENTSENNNTGDLSARNGTKASPSEEGEIGVWTLYIIVGSVAGGVLLAGLVAIAIALCCQREEESPYKSTSV